MKVRIANFRWRALLPAARALAVVALAGAIASPFLTTHGLGTDEAMNYSLAVADGVTQMRAGYFPVLVGQTEFAWNGRIHPLRTAPGLIYAAGLLDAATGHRLGFWTLQNLVVAAGLAASVLLLHGGLRRWVRAGPGPALVATAAFALGPGLLAPAYTGDLYMTVLAAPLVVLVILINLRSLTNPARSDSWLLAAGLGGAWWAHAPVAGWLTIITAGLQAVGLVIGPNRLSRMRQLAVLALAGAALAAYPFASVLTIETGRDLNQDYVGTILKQVYDGGLGALRPVNGRAYAVGNFQLGYLLWLLLGATWWRVLAVRPARGAISFRERLVVGSALAAAVFLFVLVLPVPGVTAHLWRLLPAQLGMITNIWPMQRLYLIGSVLVAGATGLAWTRIPPASRRGKLLAAIVVGVGLAWSAAEARFFIIDRGFASRRTAAETARLHRADNLDLTVTSYAFLGVPDTFYYGAMDPRFEARFLRAGRHEVTGNWEAARGPAGAVVAEGTLAVARVFSPKDFTLAPQLKLEPGKYYLLSLDQVASVEGQLEFHGPDYFRRYLLQDQIAAHGFGLLPGNRQDLALSNSRAQPVSLELVLALDSAQPQWTSKSAFAHFVLREVDMDRLPARLTSLLPLTYAVSSPADDCCLETARRYVPGYRAIVNGQPERAFRSPAGNVMVPVPKGDSTVIVRYPGPLVVRAALGISLLAGCVIVIVVAGRAAGFEWSRWRRAPRPLVGAASWPFRTGRRFGVTVLAAGVLAFAGVAWHRHAVFLRAVGPLRIRVYLPLGQEGRRQPILTTGRHGAGTVVYAAFLDENHLRVGAEIWGKDYESEPLPVNFFHEQEFVIDSSALYPADHPAVRTLNPLARHQLRGELRVELNGQLALAVPRDAFPSTLDEITVGRMQIGASTAEARFTGDIVAVDRLPIAQPVMLAPGAALRLRLRFSAAAGHAEPLGAFGPGGRDGLCYVAHLPHGAVKFGYVRPDGTTAESSPVTSRPGQSHDVQIELGPAERGGPGLAVAVRYDGRSMLGPSSLPPSARPLLATVGLNPRAAAGIATRFTGPELTVLAPAAELPAPAATPAGPCRMIVMFPGDKAGQAEPLVVTGQTGAGDFAYVSYVDDHHVRFGFDHWGVGGKVSEPVTLDLDAPHLLEVSMGSLYGGAADDPAWKAVPPEERVRLRRQRWIRLDGRTVLEADLPCHPTTAGQITLGRNLIGGSTCAAEFSGVIYSVARPAPDS